MMIFLVNMLGRLHKDDEGQGLVEYLLILALVAFAATAGMGSLASGLNSAFTMVASILGSYIK
jgi:pilus assembly protein Flp/PilA